MFDDTLTARSVIFLCGVLVGAAGGASSMHRHYKEKYTFTCPDTPVMSVYFKETGEFRCVYDTGAVSANRHYSAPTKKTLESK